MMRGSLYGALMRNPLRRLLLAALLASVCGLQGCATSIETLGLGIGIGAVGAVGAIGCAIGCH